MSLGWFSAKRKLAADNEMEQDRCTSSKYLQVAYLYHVWMLKADISNKGDKKSKCKFN